MAMRAHVRGVENVPEGAFDTLLEGAGASNNGSTTNDHIDLPANALELALFLESDRMAYLLDTMSPARVDGQRDVVKNERRQSYENRPYGVASLEIDEMLWPEGHPYHWPAIGYMEDLTASHADVVEFFKKFYAPNNASLVIAGDIASRFVVVVVGDRKVIEPGIRALKLGAVRVLTVDEALGS